jgi:hypothetical protein
MFMKRVLSSVGSFTWASIIICLITSALSLYYKKETLEVMLLSAHLPVFVALFERRVDTRGDLFEMPTFKHPYMEKLAEEVRKRAQHTIRAIGKPEPAREFWNAGEFFHFAEDRLKPLGSGARVGVACAEPAPGYASTPIKRWVAANILATERGVDFLRILIARDPKVHSIAAEQQAKGIRILVVDPKKLAALPDLCQIPEHAGFAVVNGEHVYFHNGNRANFYGVFIESPMLASVALSILAALQDNADLPGLAPAA